MKKCICKVVIVDDIKRENLCECLEVLGGFPIECGNEISVVYAGENVEVIASLFSQYKDSRVWKSSG